MRDGEMRGKGRRKRTYIVDVASIPERPEHGSGVEDGDLLGVLPGELLQKVITMGPLGHGSHLN